MTEKEKSKEDEEVCVRECEEKCKEGTMGNNNEGRKSNEKSESSKDLDDARENPNQVCVCLVCLNLKLRVILQ